MEFEEMLRIVGSEPVFETGMLLAGDVDPDHVRRQLSRWTSAGRIDQLRRGLYMLAPPYQVVKPHPFLIANRMVAGSYVSLQSALAHYGLIPEYVPTVLSTTSARPNKWQTPLGQFVYRHIQIDYLRGYQTMELAREQSALVARPEKAVLDLVYLTPGADNEEYLRGLRLQNLAQIDPLALKEMAEVFDRPKIWRAAETILALLRKEQQETEIL